MQFLLTERAEIQLPAPSSLRAASGKEKQTGGLKISTFTDHFPSKNRFDPY